ncbi:hypothetical protein [Acetivibrio straminisolvens]|jgi:hypothetical protein|uniref:DUF3899 domain-containing protein n=1 Tax=Acetivibrio straminisolvens JCM 21531 TaxID=1294263 RepID=W4V6S7_9FIRM|nr:hypothetical protein [Acetivibrio straminisolvens]GAE88896.1 hypothetical protein JCM21531_2378 [Acetivibrio straminisolvens JCM 21531]
MMIFLKILMLLSLVSGFATVFAAKAIVEKFNLKEKAKCDFENEITEEELEKYKFDKAVLSVKMTGMLIALPGLILLLIIYR